MRQFMTVFLAVLAAFAFWELSPCKKWICLIKTKSVGLYYRNSFKRTGMFLLRSAVDLAVFWFIVEWKDHLVLSILKEYGLKLWSHLKHLASYLLFLSPYGRRISSHPDFRFSLNVSSVLALLAFCITIGCLIDANVRNRAGRCVLAAAISIVMWYALFGVCCLVAKLWAMESLWFKIFCAAGSLILAFVFWGFMVVLLAEEG